MVIALEATYTSIPATVGSDVESVAPEMSKADFMVAKDLRASSRAHYMTITVPVLKRGEASMTVRWPTNRRMKTATKTATAVEIDEEVLYTWEAAESQHLSLVSVTTREALLHAIKTICCLKNHDF